MSESRVNARRGGRREGSQIVKLCVGRARATLALPGARRPERAAPQARGGPRVCSAATERARAFPPGARRAPACARRRARAARCARRRPGASTGAPPGGARAAGGSRAGGRRAARQPPGRGAPHVTAASSPHIPGARLSAPGRSVHLQFPAPLPAGTDRPREARPGLRSAGRRPPGLGRNCRTRSPFCLSVSLSLFFFSPAPTCRSFSFPHLDSEGWISHRGGGRSRPPQTARVPGRNNTS